MTGAAENLGPDLPAYFTSSDKIANIINNICLKQKTRFGDYHYGINENGFLYILDPHPISRTFKLLFCLILSIKNIILKTVNIFGYILILRME